MFSVGEILWILDMIFLIEITVQFQFFWISLTVQQFWHCCDIISLGREETFSFDLITFKEVASTSGNKDGFLYIAKYVWTLWYLIKIDSLNYQTSLADFSAQLQRFTMLRINIFLNYFLIHGSSIYNIAQITFQYAKLTLCILAY